VTVFIRTSPFDKNRKYYSNSITIELPVDTNNSLELVKTAINGLNKIYKYGYFYQKAKEKNLDINEYYFRYKGPIPQSKETAILMLADGCEAALRAMNISASDNEALETISNIIYSRKKDGQLDDSNLSKGEIFLIKRAFLNVWKRIRHRRIQYPTNKNNTFS